MTPLLRPPAFRLLPVMLALLTAPSVAWGQAVAGAGDDAIPVPKGGTRLSIGGLWNDYRDVWAPSADGTLTRRPLLGPLATPALGVNRLPQLAAAEAGIRSLSGLSAFSLSLGALDAEGEVRQSIAPIALEYGVMRRVSLRLVVPYAESRDANLLVLNRTATAAGGATVGRNPAYGTTGAQARSLNGQLLSQLDAARTALSAEVARCATPTAAQCDAIRANPAAVQQLLTRTQSTRAQLVTVYGDATRGGAPVVPIAGTAVHTGIVNTIGGLREAYAAYGIGSIAPGASPVAATVVMGPGGTGTIARDSSFGVRYAEIGNTRRAGIGDVDLTATVLLFDTFGADQRRRLLSPGRGLRASLTAGWRFGTAGADRTEDAFDVPIGEGANALLLRGTTDLLLSRALWVSATMRAVAPMSDRVAVVLPARDVEQTFAAPLRTAHAARTLGPRIDLEVAPRLSIGQFFGLSGGVLLRRWGADRFDATADVAAAEGPSAVLSVPERTMTAATVGVSFSTLASYVRGRSRFPAEVLYSHTRPLTASGGLIPVSATDRLELRLYTGFPRR